MRCVKLIHSLVLGDNVHDPLLLYQRRRPHHHHSHSHHEEDSSEEIENDDEHGRRRFYHSCLFFLPTHETVHDTRKLAAIAREMGMNFAPDPSLTHILFSWPESDPPPSHAGSAMPIPLPFPSLSSASASHLRRFARISNGLFTLVTCSTCTATVAYPDHDPPKEAAAVSGGSLFLRLSGEKIQDMEALARALTGNGWALFKTTTTTPMPLPAPAGDGRRRGDGYGGDSFVFRKVERDGTKARWRSGWKLEEEEEGYCRVREVRLPWLDFGHVVPTRILHYILLMTDDLFYLA